MILPSRREEASYCAACQRPIRRRRSSWAWLHEVNPGHEAVPGHEPVTVPR